MSEEKKNIVRLKRVPIDSKFRLEGKVYTRSPTPSFFGGSESKGLVYAVEEEQECGKLISGNTEVEYPFFYESDWDSNPDPDEFKIGDIVRLKCGGPDLVIIFVDNSSNHLTCMAYTRGDFVPLTLPFASVDKLSPKNEYTPFEKEVVGSLEQFTNDLESGRPINANPVHVFDWVQLLDRNTLIVLDYQTQEALMEVLGRIRQFMGRPAKTTS